MSWETEFLDLMPHSVIVKTRSGRNSDGSDTYSTAASTYRARVVQNSEQVRDRFGNVVQASAVAWIASTSALKADSRYHLPTGTGASTTPPVLRVENFSDDDGIHSHKVTFGA